MPSAAIRMSTRSTTGGNWRAELGGDDFAEYIDPANLVFERVLNSQDDIQVKATEKHLTIEIFRVDEI